MFLSVTPPLDEGLTSSYTEEFSGASARTFSQAATSSARSRAPSGTRVRPTLGQGASGGYRHSHVGAVWARVARPPEAAVAQPRQRASGVRGDGRSHAPRDASNDDYTVSAPERRIAV